MSVGNLMLMEDDTLMLYEADFPDYFIDKHHPDDYIMSTTPIMELIYHNEPDHNRLLLRISIKINNNMYIPATFVCDTGACVGIYTNSLLHRLISNRIINDTDSGIKYIKTSVGKINTKFTPPPHQDCNIIGLKALCKFGLELNDGGFSFKNLPDYL
jgi:hypothetical protein